MVGIQSIPHIKDSTLISPLIGFNRTPQIKVYANFSWQLFWKRVATY